MPGNLHAFDYLHDPQKPSGGVCVLFGDDPFLKQLARKEVLRTLLGDEQAELCTRYDAEDRLPEWRDVVDELATASLFAAGKPRVVEIRSADAFVSAERSRLEDWVARTKPSGMLLLEVSEWAANTRLYKAVEQSATAIECKPPQKQVGKNKVLDEARACNWLIARAKAPHGFALSRDGAEQLLELTGPSFATLEQNLAKLALLIPAGTKAGPEQVQEIVGGWRAQSSFDMIDAAAAGDAGTALVLLDRLLQAGEHPLALFGALSWSLKRYAAATRVFQESERRGKRLGLRDALVQAGVKDWPAGTLAKMEAGLKQLGRRRAGRIYRWLLDLDLSLKGTHSSDRRGRFALEHFLLRLARGAAAVH